MAEKVAALLKSINKEQKADVISVGVDLPDPPRLPCGVFPLDLALAGGIPLGRCTVIFGPEQSMKTTLALKYIGQMQKLHPEKKNVFVDLEGTFSKHWAELNGVDTKELVYTTPQHAEQAVDIVVRLCSAKDIGVICMDSLAALITQRELASNAEDAMVGVSGLLINKLYRKLTQVLTKARAVGGIPTPILINQIRYKIGVIRGDPETMPGGPSFKFASSMTLRVSGTDGKIDTAIHNALPPYKTLRVHVKKWKVPIIARNAVFDIALLPIPAMGLTVCQSYDLKTVTAYLKKFEFLVKDGKGWSVVDEAGEILVAAKTLDALQGQIMNGAPLNQQVKTLITRTVQERGGVLEPE